MKTTYALAGAALLSATTLAAPSRLADRVAKRSQAKRPDHLPSTMKPIPGSQQRPMGNGTFAEELSSNWAGIVQTAPPAGTTFSAVSTTFNIPAPQVPSGGSGTYAASAWAGIDGDTYGNAILQAGCDFTVDSSSGTSYDCWWEWYPNPLTYFDGFNPNEGDTVTVQIVADSSTSGTATLTNNNSGQQASQQLTAPSSSNALGGQNAEWILEDFEENGGLVPFANFGTVTFTGCSATAGGNNVDTDGGTMLDIENSSGQQITQTTVLGSDSLQVQYTGS